MVCPKSQLRLSQIVYISWLNKLFSKGQIGSTFMGPLASEITFAKKKLYHVLNQVLYLLEMKDFYLIPSMF